MKGSITIAYLPHIQAIAANIHIRLCKVARIRASDGLDGDWSLVVGRGGGYKHFLSGYVMLACNLMGLFISSDILGTLVRLRFVRLRFASM